MFSFIYNSPRKHSKTTYVVSQSHDKSSRRISGLHRCSQAVVSICRPFFRTIKILTTKIQDMIPLYNIIYRSNTNNVVCSQYSREVVLSDRIVDYRLTTFDYITTGGDLNVQ